MDDYDDVRCDNSGLDIQVEGRGRAKSLEAAHRTMQKPGATNEVQQKKH